MAPGKKIPKLEFKSADGAWYDVAIELRGPHLKVHYEEFDEDDDENLRWEKEFKTVDDVRSRLRFSSNQLQDQHCETLKEGMNICASFSSDGEDNKFFDAVVEQVHPSEHPLVDGERQCTCVFKVLWQAGPAANQTTSVSCENICLLTAGSIETHPVINDLLRLVEEKSASRTRSVGRNPLGSKRKNMKGKHTKNFKGRQAQQGKRADDKHMDCETPTRRDDVSFSNGREVSDNPGSMSSQSKEKEKKCEEVNATENILTSHEVLLQERAASDNELKSSVESECDVGSETNISRYSHGGTMLKEDVVLSKATIFEGENDICKKDSLPPDAASLSSQNKNIQHEIVPKNSGTIDAEILNESNKTNLNVGRKEEKPNLPDLNLFPVELETVDPCTDHLSSAMSYTNTVGNNVSTTNQKFWELDNSAVIIENSKTCHSGWFEAETVRPCHSGWLEAEDCDNLIEECTGYNVVPNIIDKSGRKDNQLAIREDQEGQEITEDKSVKDNFLCAWGRGRRDKFGDEMLFSERPVQHESQESEGTKTLKNFFQLTNGSDGVGPLRSSLTNLPSKPHNTKESLDCYGDKCGIQGQPLQSVEQIGNGVYEDELSIKHLRSNKVQTHKVSLGGVDNKNVEFINDSIDTLKSSSSLKPIKGKDLFDGFKDSSGLLEETIKEPLDCFRDEYGIQDQMLQNVEEIGKDVYGDELPVKHLGSNGLQTPTVSLGAVNSKIGEFKSVDIDALKSNCLTTLSMKPIKRREPFDSFKDLNGPPEQLKKKAHIDVCASRHEYGIQDQMLQNVEEIGKDVYGDELPVKHLGSNGLQTPTVSLGAVNSKIGEFKSVDIDALKSNSLTTLSMKPIKRREPFDSFKDLNGPPEQLKKKAHIDVCASRHEYGIQDQMLQNVEEIGKDVYGDELPVKHLGSNGLQTPTVSLGAVNSKIGEFKSVDIDALKSNCLTTLSMKPIKRREPFDSFKDLNGPPERLKKKAHIDVCASRHEQFDCDVGPLEVLPGTVVISSDDESDLAFVRKEHDHRSRDFMRQHSDHVYLQKGVHTTVDPVCKSGFVREESCKRRTEDEMYHTSMCKDNINEPAAKEDGYYCTCRSNYPKNISATQDQCNGHSLSEKYTRFSVGSDFAHTPSHWKVDPQRYCSHSSSKYYEQSRDGHMNEPGLMEDKSYCTCSFKSQKNVFVTQHQHNGHSLSEKQNYCSSGGPSHGKDHTSLMKVYALLQGDNFFIVSSNGRPWVVIDTDYGVCESTFGGFSVNSQRSKLLSGDSSALEKVYFVRKGERAYEKAKRRKDAFLEFRKNLTCLHRRLEHEEMDVVDSGN